MLDGHPLHMMRSSAFNPEKPTIRRKAEWRRIWALFLPYRQHTVLMFACIGLVALLGLGPALYTKLLIDDALARRDVHALWLDVGGMVLSALLAGLVGVYQGYLNARVGEGVMRDLRTRLVSHLHAMPLSFFTGSKTGEIMNRVSSDVDSVDGVVTGTLVSVVTNVVTMLTTLIAMFALDWRLSAAALAVLPFMILPLAPVGRRMYVIRRATREKRDEIESLTQETLSLSGITLIKSFVREEFEAKRFFETASSLMKTEISLAMVGRRLLAVIGAMVVIGPAIVWLGGGYLTLYASVSVGTVVTLVQLLSRLYSPASSLAGIQVQVISALAVFERIFDYLDMPPEGEARLIPPLLLKEMRGGICFDDVHFGYTPERQALKGVSFTIEPGQVAAFVGSSGAGKTTAAQLTARFYDPQEGSIRIDGVDLRDVDIHELRSHIGIVTQETYLFHDTIENNLRYGRIDATQEEIETAASAANIRSFIMSLPEGYQTVVGERGHKLSGGERQRLAIARVLLKNPRILILDEATSSLDSKNEALIQEALVPLLRGRTSMVIAHRLSTIVSADVIFVVEHGRIVEKGSHADLMERNGAYARLYWTQYREENRK